MRKKKRVVIRTRYPTLEETRKEYGMSKADVARVTGMVEGLELAGKIKQLFSTKRERLEFIASLMKYLRHLQKELNGKY